MKYSAEVWSIWNPNVVNGEAYCVRDLDIEVYVRLMFKCQETEFSRLEERFSQNRPQICN